MDDYVAVCVKLKGGGKRYFLTYGRLFGVVDGSELESLVLRHSSSFALGGNPVKAEVCYSLLDASKAPYFYESLMLLFKYGPTHDLGEFKTWKKAMGKCVKKGEMILYCGDPIHRNKCRSSFWSMSRA